MDYSKLLLDIEAHREYGRKMGYPDTLPKELFEPLVGFVREQTKNNNLFEQLKQLHLRTALGGGWYLCERNEDGTYTEL